MNGKPSYLSPNYATDGLCHNAQVGTFGHECRKPAIWLGKDARGWQSGFCDDCRQRGDERHGKTFERIN